MKSLFELRQEIKLGITPAPSGFDVKPEDAGCILHTVKTTCPLDEDKYPADYASFLKKHYNHVSFVKDLHEPIGGRLRLLGNAVMNKETGYAHITTTIYLIEDVSKWHAASKEFFDRNEQTGGETT